MPQKVTAVRLMGKLRHNGEKGSDFVAFPMEASGRGKTGDPSCPPMPQYPAPILFLAILRWHGKAFQRRVARKGEQTQLFASLRKSAQDEPPEIKTSNKLVLRAGGRGGWRRPGLSLGVAMAARSSFQTWLYQQSSDGSACDRLKPRG